MKHLLLSFGLLFALGASATAQISTPPLTTPKAADSDRAIIRIRQVDMLIQILPLTLRKDQYGPILTALERARAKEKQIRSLEDDDLAKIAKKLEDAVNNGIDKGEYPPKELQVEAAKLMRAMGIRRQIATAEMTDEFVEATKGVFDDGQKKVMANSLDLVLDQTKKDSMKEEDKVKFFVKRIFLDEVTYDLLLKLQKHAS
ncbi:hypothetical protein [Fimbriimonas ginsengisoli]|uniref:Uncharacterized protein n=1 Tax=Fimbriimonas ginsengisoli Gsoil 348 TaxID=661478 RepID=A0A068NM71_FIMGI|nr:hypothetical protein [Fimbriimonas ginsengisoli]AIE83885.1 hypothetical protein OP10G_0517 [Fimbriimonas ginsengisoli Gsoil 348]